MAKGINLVNYAALGAGSIAAGLVGRVIPINNPQIKSAIPIIVGYFASKMKNEPIKMLGFGMVAKGIGDLANSFGLGDEMLAANLGFDEEMSDEMLAEELEAELLAESAEELALTM